MPDVNADIRVAKLLSNIYTELFQRRTTSHQVTIKKSSNIEDIINISEYLDNTRIAALSSARWGPSSGISPFINDGIISLLFDGITGSVKIGNPSVLANMFSGGGTVEAFIRAKSVGETAGNIFNKLSWVLNVVDELSGAMELSFTALFSSVDGKWDSQNKVININEDTHVAVTYDSDSDSNLPILYVNGLQVPINIIASPTGNYFGDSGFDLYIGNTSTNTRTFDGNIYELRFWSDIRTGSEIKDNKDKHLIGNEPGLIAYYNVNANHGTDIIDKVNNNNGVITNVLWDGTGLQGTWGLGEWL